MTWSILSKSDEIAIGLKEAGNFSIWGGGSHEPYPVLDNQSFSQLQKIRTAKASWNVCSTDAPDIEIDANGTVFLTRVREDQGRAHVSINFCVYEKTPSINFTIVLPPTQFLHAFELFRTVMLDDRIAIQFHVDFYGFGTEDAAEAFLSGTPYITNSGASFAISRRFQKFEAQSA